MCLSLNLLISHVQFSQFSFPNKLFSKAVELTSELNLTCAVAMVAFVLIRCDSNLCTGGNMRQNIRTISGLMSHVEKK